MITLQKVSQLCIEKNQNMEEPMSRRSSRARAPMRGMSVKRPRSNSGTPRAWVLKGALFDLEDMLPGWSRA